MKKNYLHHVPCLKAFDSIIYSDWLRKKVHDSNEKWLIICGNWNWILNFGYTVHGETSLQNNFNHVADSKIFYWEYLPILVAIFPFLAFIKIWFVFGRKKNQKSNKIKNKNTAVSKKKNDTPTWVKKQKQKSVTFHKKVSAEKISVNIS